MPATSSSALAQVSSFPSCQSVSRAQQADTCTLNHACSYQLQLLIIRSLASVSSRSSDSDVRSSLMMNTHGPIFFMGDS
jgi:hypothetical protein